MISSPRKMHPAALRGIDPVDDVEQGGFAGAVGTDQPQNLPGAQIEGNVGEGLEAAEALGNVLNLEYHSSTFCKR